MSDREKINKNMMIKHSLKKTESQKEKNLAGHTRKQKYFKRKKKHTRKKNTWLFTYKYFSLKLLKDNVIILYVKVPHSKTKI